VAEGGGFDGFRDVFGGLLKKASGSGNIHWQGSIMIASYGPGQRSGVYSAITARLIVAIAAIGGLLIFWMVLREFMAG
jgi:hypothetical protein